MARYLRNRGVSTPRRAADLEIGDPAYAAGASADLRPFLLSSHQPTRPHTDGGRRRRIDTCLSLFLPDTFLLCLERDSLWFSARMRLAA